MLLVVAVVFGAVAVSPVSTALAQGLRIAICRVFSGDCGPAVRVAQPVPLDTSGTGAGDEPAPPIDDARVTAAVDSIDAALDPGGWGVRGGDLEDLREIFEGLTPAEADAVVAQMSDEQIARWFDQMNEGWLKGGWSAEERRELYLVVGTRVSPETWRRLARFTDEIDPAPIGALDDDASPDRVADYERFGYRPFDGPLAVLGDDDADAFAPDDVYQGSIGDCYLIAALQAIADTDPDAIERMIEPNGNGSYTVTFADGERVVVTPEYVHDPDSPDDPVFAHNRPDEVDGGEEAEQWPLLIEKAYAQRSGGWEPIVGGDTGRAIEDLVGWERDGVDDDDIDGLVERYNDGAIVAVGTIDRPDDMDNEEWLEDDAPGPFTDGRLFQNHAFVVVGVDEDAGTIDLRNPWYPGRDPVTVTYEEFEESIGSVSANTP